MRRSDYLALGAAGIAFALSVALRFGGARDEGLFVAVWVPSILKKGDSVWTLRDAAGLASRRLCSTTPGLRSNASMRSSLFNLLILGLGFISPWTTLMVDAGANHSARFSQAR